MSQTVVNAHIVGQSIQMTNLPLIASGIEGALGIACDFSEEWGGYGKIAVFYRNEAEVYHVPLVNDLATVPHEVLAAEGFFYFGIMGTAENTRTTEVLRVNVVKGAITAATAEPAAPTQSIYKQLVAAYGLASARLDELVKMRGASADFEDWLSDEYISGPVYNNGASVYVDLTIKNMSLVAGGSHYTDYFVPPYHAPLCPVYLETTNSDINVTITKADTVLNAGYSRILIENVGNDMLTTDMEVSCRGFYPRNSVFVEELGDIRVGVDGTAYLSAGEAVREQVKQLKEGAAGGKLTEAVLMQDNIQDALLKIQYYLKSAVFTDLRDTANYTPVNFPEVSPDWLFTPGASGDIKCPVALETTGTWEVKTRVFLNPAKRYGDIMATVNDSGEVQSGAIIECAYNGDGTLTIGLFVKPDGGSSLNVSRSTTVNQWVDIRAGFSGDKYFMEITEESGEVKLSEKANSAATPTGKYPVFGKIVNGYFDGKIDLAKTEVIMNGEVVWRAVV